MVTVNETLIREILDRLIRLETLVAANNESTNARIDDTNKRIDDTNHRITETNHRITETNHWIVEANQRITETNQRITENSARIDALSHESARRFDQLNGRMDRLFYTMLGLGAAIIAALVAGQVLD